MSEAYDACSRQDMVRLARDLIRLPSAARPAVCARIMAERLMLPRQWWVRFVVWLAKKRHGLDDYGAWSLILANVPGHADELIAQTSAWITDGKDAGGQGVGGFDQREVNATATIIGQALLYRWDHPA